MKTYQFSRFSSYGFIRFYVHNGDGTRTQIGGISSRCTLAEVEEAEREAQESYAAKCKQEVGE